MSNDFRSAGIASDISGSKKPVRLLMSNDSAGVKVGQYQPRQLQNYRPTQSTILVVFSDGTCRGFLATYLGVFFRNVLMMKLHRACTHDRRSFVSPRTDFTYLNLY